MENLPDRFCRPFRRIGSVQSKGIENVFAGHTLVTGDASQDSVEGSDPQRFVGGHRDTLRARLIGLQDDVATHLVNLPVIPVST